MCAAAQAEKLIKKFSGSHIDKSQFGVKDKYEQAMMRALIKLESGLHFIDDVHYGE